MGNIKLNTDFFGIPPSGFFQFLNTGSEQVAEAIYHDKHIYICGRNQTGGKSYSYVRKVNRSTASVLWYYNWLPTPSTPTPKPNGWDTSIAYCIQYYDNHLYIAGLAGDATSGSGYPADPAFVTKMDLNGNIIWTTCVANSYNTTYTGETRFKALRVDASGVYASGSYYSSSGYYKAYTALLNLDGIFQSESQLSIGGTTTLIESTTTDADYYYLAGTNTNGTYTRLFVGKYAKSNHAQQWNYFYDPGTYDYGYRVGVNSTHVYLFGQARISNYNQFALQKRDLAGNLVNSYTFPISNVNCYATDMYVDTDALYLAGYFLDGVYKSRIMKVDLNGTAVWTQDNDLVEGAGVEGVYALDVDDAFVYGIGNSPSNSFIDKRSKIDGEYI